MNLPPREKAIELLKKYNPSEADMNHYLESEAIMEALAKRLGENGDYWGRVGLLHDVDWTLTKDNYVEHGSRAPKILNEAGYDEEFIENVISHIYGFELIPKFANKKRTKKIEYCLAAGETLTGLIHAYALMRGKKISNMEVKGLRKKFKDKTFASGCDRNIIKEVENVGLTLDEFFALSIEAINNIKNEVNLE